MEKQTNKNSFQGKQKKRKRGAKIRHKKDNPQLSHV